MPFLDPDQELRKNPRREMYLVRKVVSRMESDIAELIRGNPFFAGLSAPACQRLARVCRSVALRKGHVLFMEQTRGTAMYVLLDGRVRLFKTTEAGDEVVIRTIKPGESFAEVVLFEQVRYPVSAVALTTGRALSIPREDVVRLLENAAFRNAFIAMLMRKQRYLAERLHEQQAFDVGERFVRFLREQYGEQPVIEIGLTKQDVAAAIGATPETFSRLLRRLADAKQLTWSRRILRVSDSFWRRG
jgi:CRP-like cAMP-binding protein